MASQVLSGLEQGLDPLANVPMRVVTADHLGLILRARVWGDPAKPPVILQHGGKDHARSWDFVIAELVEEFCCIAPDLRGHGDSDRPTGGGYGTSEFVNDFALVIDALKADGILGPYAIIGHSLGGNITLHYAASCPDDVSVLVNIEGLGSTSSRFDKWLTRSVEDTWSASIQRRRAVCRRDRRGHSFVAAVKKLAAVHPYLSQDHVAYLVKHGTVRRDDKVYWKHDVAIDYTNISMTPPAKTEMIRNAVTAPTALFYGGESFLGPFERDDPRFGQFPNARVYFYDEAGHWLHHQEMDRFVGDIKQELRSHGAS